MRHFVISLTAAATLAIATPALAQEVLVTATRNSNYVNGMVAAQRSIVTLKRRADYVIRAIRLTGDTRDAATRKAEIDATLRNMIAAAPKAGVELAIGDYVVEPLTVNNLGRLAYTSDGRPDTSQTTFLVKVRLTPDMTLLAAQLQMVQFFKTVNKVGRTSFSDYGDSSLSVVNPDQYRPAIADLIAADAAVMATKFGPAYGVEVTGLDRPVEWARAGSVEVFLYLPSSYTVTRK